MNIAVGDLYCKALYYGDILIWAITSSGEEYLNGTWIDSLTWDDNETFNEQLLTIKIIILWQLI